MLLRSPYGRNGLTGVPLVAQARVLAARGYAVVVQDVRGRFGSTGEFVPMVHEVVDARATIDWVTSQPWSNGELGVMGASYVGGTAWAAAVAAPDTVKALAVAITHTSVGLPDARGVLHPDTSIRWIQSLDAMHDTDQPALRRLRQLVANRMPESFTAEAMTHLPVVDLDERILGRRSPVWRHWAAHPSADDEFWAAGDLREHVGHAPPTVHVSGWYDLFIDDHVPDIHRQRPHGTVDRVVIGPWGHLHPRVQLRLFAEGLDHFDHHLHGDGSRQRGVELWFGGVDQWWRGDDWPEPAGTLRLAVGDPAGLRGTGRRFRYDPADPTPAAGGRTLAVDAGPADCAPLAARDDVLVFTSEPLRDPVTLLGAPLVVGSARSDTGVGDVWARLADVDRTGLSTSVSDGLQRLQDAHGGEDLRVGLHPVAHTFQRGHRIRLHVAGGAFPLHDRNLGFAGQQLTGTTHRPSTVTLDDVELVLPLTGLT